MSDHPQIFIKDRAITADHPSIIVSLMGGDPGALLAEVQSFGGQLPDLFEWRLDYMSALAALDQRQRPSSDEVATLPQNDDLQASLRVAAPILREAATTLREATDLPILATLRTKAEGGEVQPSPAYYKEVLRFLIAERLVDAVDVEWHTGPHTVAGLIELADKAGIPVVLSAHYFDGTPPAGRLKSEMLEMAASGADIVKMACMPHKREDVLSLMNVTAEFATRLPCPLIVMAMGRLGVVSRMAGASFGSAATFAAHQRASAPGQVALPRLRGILALQQEAGNKDGELDEVLERARKDRQPTETGAPQAKTDIRSSISGHTSLYCLLGSPVAHSLSPAIYNHCFIRDGIDAVYLTFDVKKDGMEKALEAFRLLGIRGGNVTMPGKNEAWRLVDERSPVAEVTGAVNTIVNEDGRLVGHMTDGVGLTGSLREAGVELAGQRMVLLGAGGAATAIVAQAVMEGAHVHVFTRRSANFDHMEELLDRLKERWPEAKLAITDIGDRHALCKVLGETDILVNATPLGMEPHPETTPVPETDALSSLSVVVDIVYDPSFTRLMKDARAAGVPLVLGGHGMLLHQAAAAYKLFTGHDLPTAEVAAHVFGQSDGSASDRADERR